MKKTIILTSLVWLMVFALYSVFGPANVLRELNPDSVLREQVLKRELDGLEIKGVEYLGDRSYLIRTTTKDFVAVQEYTSTMNYKWQVFESKGEFVQ